MKELMKKAWAIYRTLTIGTHFEKLSVALRRAWKEVKAMTMTLKKDLGCIGKSVTTGEVYRNGEDRLTIVNFSINVTELQGTEKQTAYAESIRARKINDFFCGVCEQIKKAGAQNAIENFRGNGVAVVSVNDVIKYTVETKMAKLIAETSAKAIIEA